MIANLKNLVVIGDRILLKPLAASSKTGSGLYLPPGVKEHDAVHTGLVVKVGPGYPIPSQDPDSFLKENSEVNSYVPLQVKAGDQALYLHANAFELEFEGEKFEVVNQNAILVVFREDFSELV
jgi:co-chaperonin GroES (HSP10)